MACWCHLLNLLLKFTFYLQRNFTEIMVNFFLRDRVAGNLCTYQFSNQFLRKLFQFLTPITKTQMNHTWILKYLLLLSVSHLTVSRIISVCLFTLHSRRTLYIRICAHWDAVRVWLCLMCGRCRSYHVSRNHPSKVFWSDDYCRCGSVTLIHNFCGMDIIVVAYGFSHRPAVFYHFDFCFLKCATFTQILCQK